MAGWPTLKDCSKNNGLCFDLYFPVKGGAFDDSKDRPRSLFDQVLSVFSTDISVDKCVRPIPALLGDGRPVDLFKLFWVVKERGGYDSVSRNGLWAFVAEECGLGVELVASVKVIYIKYLNELDQWLGKVFRNKSFRNGETGVGGKLDLLLWELESEFRGLVSSGQNKKGKDGELVEWESYKNGTYDHLDNAKNELHLSDASFINKVHENAKRMINDDDEKFSVEEGHDVLASAKSDVENVLDSWKRKRESLSLSGMLDWVIEAAKHSDDPAIGIIPECSNWKEHGNEELWVQVLLAREALLIRRHIDLNTKESPLQKKLRMHPGMYEDSDVLNHQSTERLRCSKRLPLTKSYLCPCCNSCSGTQSKPVSPQKAEVEKSPKEPALVTVEIEATNDDVSRDEPLQKQVSVGPIFQAEVPEWAGVISESDSKWLGTLMCSPEDGKNKSPIEMDRIGKGRENSCDCTLPGSTDCVRFHIAEKRMNLKLEIGLLFYHWRFDRMGEEVSLSWTIEEEKRFKYMVGLPSASPNKFWNNAFKFFPTKTREKLVSYYFNVFVVRRRSYQNRVTPKHVDSDDDESEFGSVGTSFGYEAIRVPGSKLLTCTQNKQCTNLEE